MERIIKPTLILRLDQYSTYTRPHKSSQKLFFIDNYAEELLSNTKLFVTVIDQLGAY
jgi:hypothetical protein